MILRSLAAVALCAAPLPSSVSAAQQQAQPQRRTAMLGTRPQQFLLSKITVSDLPRSFKFYTQVIGLKWATGPGIPPQNSPTAADPERDFVEIPLNFSGSLADPFFVLIKRKGEKPSPELTKLIWIGFKVPSAREAVARAAAAGYKSSRGEPGEGPMAFGFITDPDGYNIEFVQAPSYQEK